MDLLEIFNDITQRAKNSFDQVLQGFSIEDSSLIIHSTDLDNFSFGLFWFQIKSIKFSDTEIKIKVRILREVNCTFVNNTPSTKNRVILDLVPDPIEWKEIINKWKNSTLISIKNILYHKISWQSISNTLQFAALVLITISLETVNFIKWIGFFSIRLIFELSNLIKVCTPIFMEVLNFMSKIIGGFYILMVIIWKDSIGSVRRTPQLSLENTKKPYQSVYRKNLY